MPEFQMVKTRLKISEKSGQRIRWAHFKRFMDDHAKVHKKTWRNDRNMFNEYLSTWVNRKISSIRKSEVQKLHNTIGKVQKHPYMANRMHALLHTLFEMVRIPMTSGTPLRNLPAPHYDSIRHLNTILSGTPLRFYPALFASKK